MSRTPRRAPSSRPSRGSGARCRARLAVAGRGFVRSPKRFGVRTCIARAESLSGPGLCEQRRRRASLRARPVSTEGWTRRVHFVREGGVGVKPAPPAPSGRAGGDGASCDPRGALSCEPVAAAGRRAPQEAHRQARPPPAGPPCPSPTCSLDPSSLMSSTDEPLCFHVSTALPAPARCPHGCGAAGGMA